MGKLPNFFLFGAAKSGTTSIYKVLSQSEHVFEPAVKEPFYYTSDIYKGSGHAFVVPDYSTTYLYHSSLFIEKLKKERGGLEGIKFLAVLRHPAERVKSHYRMLLSQGVESLPPHDAFAIGSCERRKTKRWGYDYLGFSSYIEQLTNIERQVSPDSIKVLNYDLLKTNPTEFYSKIFTFLDIEIPENIIMASENTSFVPKHTWLAKAVNKASFLRPVFDRNEWAISRMRSIKKKIESNNKSQEDDIFCDVDELLGDYFEEVVRKVKAKYQGFESWK